MLCAQIPDYFEVSSIGTWTFYSISNHNFLFNANVYLVFFVQCYAFHEEINLAHSGPIHTERDISFQFTTYQRSVNLPLFAQYAISLIVGYHFNHFFFCLLLLLFDK